MPQQRVSQTFKDISMSFETNPLNDDLIALKNSSAIARSIRNIVFTQPGEKFFNPEFGSRVSESLFEIVDEVSTIAIRDEIRSSIINYEPRVNLLDVLVNPNPDENEMNVTIKYEIVGIDIPPQQLDFVLLPTR
jgi:phage baseplate assembly protein W